MEKIEKSIDVNVPVHTAYNQWTQFEEFPRFMEGVKEVKQLDAKRLHWKAEILGKEIEWDAHITEQTPDRQISWESTSGAVNRGTVMFKSSEPNKTRITLDIEYEPRGATEKLGDIVGALSSKVEGDLERFKDFIEQRGSETGSWRGEIKNRKV
ncbi:MAG: SRPBCC family protein [Candidatus Jettenia sp. CY-1]|nr:MAG: SRPBCC family protein [Candidatus Jettenia sp.]WKZ20282.1 MAG: SRPBCC family protein [Candidatus Jettenia sp. CY-1]